MNNNNNVPPTEPKRVKAFAIFFKRYMNISSLVVASLPIPVTALKLVPIYKAQTNFHSVYTPLFCFLALAFIFFHRHQLARVMFPRFFGITKEKAASIKEELVDKIETLWSEASDYAGLTKVQSELLRRSTVLSQGVFY